MSRLLTPLATAAILAATGALAQVTIPGQSNAPANLHSATINNIKVSGMVATGTNQNTGAGAGDAVANLLDHFSSAQPVMPVLTPPANPSQSGTPKDSN